MPAAPAPAAAAPAPAPAPEAVMQQHRRQAGGQAALGSASPHVGVGRHVAVVRVRVGHGHDRQACKEEESGEAGDRGSAEWSRAAGQNGAEVGRAASERSARALRPPPAGPPLPAPARRAAATHGRPCRGSGRWCWRLRRALRASCGLGALAHPGRRGCRRRSPRATCWSPSQRGPPPAVRRQPGFGAHEPTAPVQLARGSGVQGGLRAERRPQRACIDCSRTEDRSPTFSNSLSVSVAKRRAPAERVTRVAARVRACMASRSLCQPGARRVRWSPAAGGGGAGGWRAAKRWRTAAWGLPAGGCGWRCAVPHSMLPILALLPLLPCSSPVL